MLYEEPIKNVRPDPRGRIGLGSDLVGDHKLFKVFKNLEGDIVLRPYVEVPERELWLLQDKEAMAIIEESFEQAQAGKLKEIPSKYFDLGDE